MTNILIRKMIYGGLSPEEANCVCMRYIRESSLSALEMKILNMEGKRDVDKVQSESDWAKCRRLRC